MTDLPTPKPTPARSIHPALIFGIVFLPIIFAWFTLAKGVGKWTRLAAFGWLAAFLVLMHYHPAPDPAKPEATQTAALSSASATAPSIAAPPTAAAAQSSSDVDVAQAADNSEPSPDAPIDANDHRTFGEAKLSYERDMAYVQAYAEANESCISGQIQLASMDKSRNQIIEDITRKCVQYAAQQLKAGHNRSDPYEMERDYVRGKVLYLPAGRLAQVAYRGAEAQQACPAPRAGLRNETAETGRARHHHFSCAL